MDLALPPDMQKFIEERVKAGEYARAEDVVHAALARLMQGEESGFAPGELDTLLAEGEADIERGDVISADRIFADLRGTGGNGQRPGRGE